ncbi:calcium-dependent phosphotriesterase [Bimuria novae-zelandiae CBS 107.79]|uniref:Calcium-dependent phosphotriesterase n=1 Tax=Bimuria novae-zelandiae CBS 107.79 TaxID=1447943 RepID=A0A6A5UUA5_9PLEO|nr:calcium-dependent phosphotriesterase [Bimuria novae-zelandiae CBS 107.79]
MSRRPFIFGSLLVAFGAAVWQLMVRDALLIVLGIGRVIQTVDEFPYTCRTIDDERLTACEDLWLDDEQRIVYAACATTQGRLAWNQAVGRVNVSARRTSGTDFLALSVDQQLENGSFPIQPIGLSGYISNSGDSSIDVLGFDAEITPENTVHFYLTNQRPPVDAQGNYIDASVIGANSTIEVFEHDRGSSTMRHVRTIWDPENVYTPNNVAAIGGGEFVLTNDHTRLLNWRRSLDFYIGGGGVSHCDASGKCTTVTPPRAFKMPNGLARGLDGLIYVPSSVTGTITVYSINRPDPNASLASEPKLTILDTIHVGMGLDNIALDLDGDLWAAGFADGIKLMKWMEDPVGERVPSTVWRVRKKHGDVSGYQVDKVIEDSKARILNAVTTIRHDTKTGRLFMGGEWSVNFELCGAGMRCEGLKRC